MPDDLERHLRQNPSHLSLNRRALDIAPKYCRSTVSMVHSTFPDGPPLEYYGALLYLFRQQSWSFRAVASAIEICFEKEYNGALHDAYGCCDDPEAPPDKIEPLRQHLAPHGLKAWEKENAST
ncbi:MAG TPA: hypothetical protein VKV04_14065 [Verrucomicrobiae bacterium]|nr:hypothetical protein [Verrucomicrobiae bacterium]